MDDGPRLRVRESPTGGSRIAFSYLGTLLAAVVTGLGWVMTSPLVEASCRSDEGFTCVAGWTIVSVLLMGLAGLALGAWAFRLGWEWWAVVAGLSLASPWWSALLPGWAGAVVALLGPAMGALATLDGPRRPPWRPWVPVAVSLVLVALGGWSIVP